MNILLNYVFPITAISPTPAASTAFLKQVCAVCLPKSGQEGNVGELFLCTSQAQIAARTDNAEVQELLNAGMSRVYVLLAEDLDIAAALVGHESDFFTILISSDFDDADIDPTQADGEVTISSYANLVSGTPDTLAVAGVTFTAQSGAATPGTASFRAATSNDATATSLATQINEHLTTKALVTAAAVGAVVTITAKNAGSAGNDIAVAYTDNDTNVGITLAGLSGGNLAGGDGLFLGQFAGVVGISTADDEAAADYAATENYCAFHSDTTNYAKNMFYAFGKLLSNALDWTNQQYITMPYADDVEDLGTANALFDDKISFVMDDAEFGKRLGLFAVGGKAIVAPYIIRNLELDMQSKATQYISGNQPSYSKTDAALLEDELQAIISGKEGTPGYIQKGWLTGGTVEVTLAQDNFVASAEIQVPTPRALWRVFGNLTQS